MKLTLEALEALEALDAIERQGSFAAAARHLHRVPSALTYTVQKLEQDLDALLFDRRGHRAVLTDAGRALLEEGRHLLAAAGSLECRVRQVAKGWEAELVIAVNDLLPRAPLYDLLAAFYAEHRETRIRLVTEILTGCWDALASGLGVGYLPRWLARPEIEAGRLVEKLPEEGLPREALWVAWRSGNKGRALSWFRERLAAEGAAWLESTPP